jgi:hypothetical protein
MEDNLLSKVLRGASAFVLGPKRVFADPAYYELMKGKANWQKFKEGELTLSKAEEILETNLKERLQNIELLSNRELTDLAADLFIAFKSSRHFREGWVVDEYWRIYKMLEKKYQIELDTRTAF